MTVDSPPGLVLKSLRLRRFKKFTDMTVAFAPGLNVISGPNEAGKSTLMEALFAALLVNPAQPPAGFAGTARPWGQQRLGEVVLELDADGHEYLLRKDFEAGTALLQPQDGGTRIDAAREIQRLVLAWIGVPAPEAFRATAYVGQGELARLADARHLIGSTLAKILSGSGAEDVAGAVKWIDERSRALARGGEGNGATAPTEERVLALGAQAREADRAEERAVALRGELRTAARQLAELEEQIARRRTALQAAEERERLRRQEEALAGELRALGEALTQSARLRARLDELEQRLSRFSGPQQHALQTLTAARRIAESLAQTVRTGQEQLQREEGVLEQLATRHQRARRRAVLGLIAGGVGAAVGVAGTLLALVRDDPWGWPTALAAVIVVVIGLGLRARIGQTEGGYRQQEHRVLDLRRRLRAARDQHGRAEQDVTAGLDGLSAASLRAVEDQFAGHLEVARQHDEVRMALRQLLGERSPEDVARRLKGIEGELADVRRGLLGVGAGEAQPIAAREQMAAELQAWQTQAAAMRAHTARLQGMLDALDEAPERRAQVAEQLAALRAEQAREAAERAALDLARRFLVEARTQAFVPARGLLERRAGEYLRQATRGAYDRVTVNEKTLAPKVWTSSAGDWKGPEALSRGTVDQLYLSLRLALLEVVCRGRTPPVFLDEPFAYFDPDRVKGVVALLHQVARRRQVFLFTSWPHADLPVDHVIALPLATSPPASPHE